jgi:urease accessory protein
MANVVFCHASAQSHLDAIRAALPDTAGASLLNDTTLVVRILAADSFALRQYLMPIMTLLTDDAVPKNWRL